MPKLKEMKEKRNSALEKAEAILNKATEEVRALTEDEPKEYDDFIKEADALGETIKKMEEKRSKEVIDGDGSKKTEEEEIRSFEGFLRGTSVEERAFSAGENGAILPKTVAQKIITRTKELCPIMQLATVYNIKGDFVLPVYDETEGSLTVNYVDELGEITESGGKLTSIQLNSFIAGVVTPISKKLINNMDFDIVGFVIEEVAKKFAEFIEKEALAGTEAAGKMEGIFETATNVVDAAGATLTVDDLINLQLAVPTAHQANAVWLMNPKTFAAARKLKDENKNPILIPDMAKGEGYTILGKHVYLSENAPVIAASANAVAYGDISGYVIKLSNGIEIEILKEVYAKKYAVGVIGYTELDGAVAEQSKIAVLKMGA